MRSGLAGLEGSTKMKKDTVYSIYDDPVDAFKFDARVADVFENMISRSVPGYPLVLRMIGVLAGRYARDDTNCYDPGCFPGASTLKMRNRLSRSRHVIAMDNSPAMVERCRANPARDHSEATVDEPTHDQNAR